MKMKVLETFLIINEYDDFAFLKGYKTESGWYKEEKRNGSILLKKTTMEEIFFLSEKLEKLIKKQT